MERDIISRNIQKRTSKWILQIQTKYNEYNEYSSERKGIWKGFRRSVSLTHLE